jgi:hypothetical protein
LIRFISHPSIFQKVASIFIHTTRDGFIRAAPAGCFDQWGTREKFILQGESVGEAGRVALFGVTNYRTPAFNLQVLAKMRAR